MRKIMVLAFTGAFALASGSAFADCVGHQKTVSDSGQQTVMTDQSKTTPATTTKSDRKG